MSTSKAHRPVVPNDASAVTSCRYCGGPACGALAAPPVGMQLAMTKGGGMTGCRWAGLALRRAAQAVRSRATRKVLPSLAIDRTVLTLLVATLLFWSAGHWLFDISWPIGLAGALTGAFTCNVVQHAVEIRKRDVFSARAGSRSASWLMDTTAEGGWQAHGLTGTRGSGLGLALLDAARHAAPPGTRVSFRAANPRLARRYRELGFVDATSRTGLWARRIDRLWPPLTWQSPAPQPGAQPPVFRSAR